MVWTYSFVYQDSNVLAADYNIPLCAHVYLSANLSVILMFFVVFVSFFYFVFVVSFSYLFAYFSFLFYWFFKFIFVINFFYFLFYFVAGVLFIAC